MTIVILILLTYSLTLNGMEQQPSFSVDTPKDLALKQITISTKDISCIKIENSTAKILYQNSNFFRKKIDNYTNNQNKIASKNITIPLNNISHNQLVRAINLMNWAQNKNIIKESLKQQEEDLEVALALEAPSIIEPYTKTFLDQLFSEKQLDEFKHDPYWSTKAPHKETLITHLVNAIIDATKEPYQKYSPIEQFRQRKAHDIKPVFIVINNKATQIATNALKNELAVGDSQGYIHIFSLPDGKKNKELKSSGIASHINAILSLVYHPTENKILLSSCTDSKISRWNTQTGDLITTLNRQSPRIKVAALYYDGLNEQIISGGSNGVIHIWNNKLNAQEESSDIGHFDIQSIAYNSLTKRHYVSDRKKIKTVELKENGNHIINELTGDIKPEQIAYLDHIVYITAQEDQKKVADCPGLPNPDTTLGQYAAISPGTDGQKETTIDIYCAQSKARKFSLVIGSKNTPSKIHKIIFSANGETLVIHDNQAESVKIWPLKNFNDAYCRLSLSEALFLYIYFVKNEKEIVFVDHLRAIAEKFGLITQEQKMEEISTLTAALSLTTTSTLH